VFDLYQRHQGATSLPVDVAAPNYVRGDVTVPALSASASRGASGEITVSLVNLDPVRSARVALGLNGAQVRAVSARVITAAAFDAHSDFGGPDPLAPQDLATVKRNRGGITFVAPPKSVTVLTLR
jgi:alpha-N-arabinofuranosidase